MKGANTKCAQLRYLTDRVLSGQPVSSGWPFFDRFYELSDLFAKLETHLLTEC
jgi:hypothetical protein